jgi:hypothetical protein
MWARNPVNCWNILIGQSAAKPLRNELKVQRLVHGVSAGKAGDGKVPRVRDTL